MGESKAASNNVRSFNHRADDYNSPVMKTNIYKTAIVVRWIIIMGYLALNGAPRTSRDAKRRQIAR